MPLKKLNFNIYEEYRDTISRYMELHICDQKDKIDTATLHILYAIQDINTQIEKYNKGELDISIYYQMMIKTDFLIAAVEFLNKIFNIVRDRDKLWGGDHSIIRKFRLYRSLTLAHPLETTRYEDLGFGKKNNKWCEDIRIKGAIDKLFNNQLSNADFIMLIKEEGEDFEERKAIFVKNDILDVVSTALQHLQIFTKTISSKLDTLIKKLRNTPIQAQKNMDILDYISILKPDLEERYPSEIEKIIYENGEREENSILNRALKMLKFTFENISQEEKYKIYKEEIKQAVYFYGDSIQNMDLEESQADERLSNILYPDSSVLVETSNDSQAYYKYSKISYLADSKEYSVKTAQEKLKHYGYEGCRGIGVCTNAEWAIIQLLDLQEELNLYFQLDFNTNDKCLYIQYCTALYFANLN